MQNKTWEYIDKSDWGSGVWESEPDKEQWTDEATGLPCLAVRSPHHGGWCGYVGVAEGHPLYQVNYDDARNSDGEYIGVHGGLTFSDFCQQEKEQGICHVPDEGEPEKVWWLGFDFAHAGDLCPAYAARFSSVRDYEQYRDLQYVKEQCSKLASQLILQEAA
jgi:hypothetical protein